MARKRFYNRTQIPAAFMCCTGVLAAVVAVLTVVINSSAAMEYTGNEFILVPPLELGTVRSDGAAKETELPTEPPAPEYTEEYLGDWQIAAYCSCERCVNRSDGYRTYSGEYPVQGVTVAAKLDRFLIGDKVKVGDQIYVVQDKLSPKAKEELSLYFNSHEAALDFGRRVLPVYMIHQETEHAGTSIGIFEVTGYCSCEICCGEDANNLTKSGTVPKSRHTVAADPELFEMGTKLEIDGVIYTVEDTGKAVKGKVIDIYFDTHEEASRYGRQERYVYLVP